MNAYLSLFFRMIVLAIVNTVFLGVIGLSIHALVQKPHRAVDMAVISFGVVTWVIGFGYMWLAARGDLFPWSALRERCPAPLLRAARSCLRGFRLLLRRCLRLLPIPNRGAVAASTLPQVVVVPLQQEHGMDMLPREPPVRDSPTRVVAMDDIPFYEHRDAARPDECTVCLDELEKGETVKWLPQCLHSFHQQCIDRWLRDHSTCPICRCDVFAPLPI